MKVSPALIKQILRGSIGSLILGSLLLAFLTGCSMTPKNAYALRTADHGQCHPLKKGERIYYKKKRVKYLCEDSQVLFSKPYKVEEEWYFPSGYYDGKRVRNISAAKVDKVYHNICQVKGLYGSGDQKVKKFEFDTKLKRCRPFEWSGQGGFVPFDSIDECEMECYY